MSTLLNDRLRQVRDRTGLTQKQFAKKLGLGLNSWQKWETNGILPPSDVLSKLAEDGISIDWLITGFGRAPISNSPLAPLVEVLQDVQERSSLQHLARELQQRLAGGQDETTAPQIDDQRFVLVPRYDIQASAGPGAWNDEEQIVDWLAFSRTWVHNTLRADPSRLVLLTAVGDSMEPTIRAGDLLLIDTGLDHFRDDAIYVIQIAGQLMVKRVQRFFDGGVAVKSDNADAYVEQRLTAEEAAAARVAGRVRWVGRMI